MIPRNSIVPVCEIWFQTNGDVQDLLNMYRVRARVHTDTVPKDAVLVALREVIRRLENDSSKLLIMEHDDSIILAKD